MPFCCKTFISRFFVSSFLLLTLGLSLPSFAGDKDAAVLVFPQIGIQGQDFVFSTAYAPDGKTFATGIAGQAILWNAETGKELRRFSGFASSVDSLSYSPDSRYLATASSDDTAVIWDIETGKKIRSFKGSSGYVGSNSYNHKQRAVSLDFAPDGRTIAWSVGNQIVDILNIETGRQIKAFEHDNYVRSLAYSPDGKLLATGLSHYWEDSGRTITLWDVESGKVVRTLTGHEEGILSLDFSPDGSRLISASIDEKAIMWDVQSGQILYRLREHDGAVTHAEFSPDGWTLVTTSRDSQLIIYDAISGLRRKSITSPHEGIIAASFSPDGKKLLIGTLIGGAGIVRLPGGEKIAGLESSITSVGHTAITRDLGHGFVARSGGLIHVWDLKQGRMIEKIKVTDEVKALILSPDETLLAIATKENDIKLWDRARKEVVHTLKGPKGQTYFSIDVRFSKNGKELIGGYEVYQEDGFPKHFSYVWNVESGQEIWNFPGDYPQLSNDGNLLLTAQREKKYSLWSLETGREIRSFDDKPSEGGGGIFVPDERKLITQRFGEIRQWGVKKGKLLGKLSGNVDAISPDRSMLLLHGHNQTSAKIIDSNSGKTVSRLSDMPFFIKGASFSPDGRHLLVSHQNGAVAVINVKSGKRERWLKGHNSAVLTYRFSQDGKRLVTQAYDAAIRLWDFETGREVAQFLAFTDGSWMVSTPQGFFDLSSPKAASNLNIVKGLEAYSIESFYDQLYRPDLVAAALSGDRDGLVVAAAKKLNLEALIDGGLPPAVAIVTPKDAIELDTDRLDLTIRLDEKNGGYGRIEYRVNGKVQGGTRGLGAATSDQEGAGEKSHLQTKSLFLSPGENEISVVAYNRDNTIASNPAVITVKVAAKASRPAELYIISLGINDYFDRDLALNHAVSDAQALAEAAARSGKEAYAKVHRHILVNEKVTKAGIEALFADLSKKIKPHDAFLFFVAGHGKTIDGRYYFLPQDFRYRNAASVVTDGLGQEIWQDWFSRIPAQRSLLLYDTCESGSLTANNVVLRGGLERKGAIDRFAHATGRAILTAATDTAPALEGYRGHGLFTYALLEAFAKGDQNKDKALLTTELATYVDIRLPELSKEAFGYHQIPQMQLAGNAFPIGMPVAFKAGAQTTSPVPVEPTHFVASSAKVFGPDGTSVLMTLQPGMQVVVLSSGKDRSAIALKGKRIGSVANETLIKIRE